MAASRSDPRIEGRERLGEALRRDERLTKALLEAIPDLVFRLDRKGTFLDFLPARGMDLYVPAEDFLGKNLEDILPSIAPGALEKVARALATGTEQTLEYELPLDGVARFFEARFVASADSEVLAIVRDVTERRSSAEKLRQSEERFRSLVETAGDVILLLSPDGEILEFNREAEKLHGVSRERVLGKSYADGFLPAAQRSRFRVSATKALEGVPARGQAFAVLAAGARNRILSWNLDRFLDSDGRAIGFIACGHDVTEQKELEESVLSIARGVSAATGQKFFRNLTLRLAEILGADYAMVGELENQVEGRRIRTRALVAGGKLERNTVYDLDGSPCEKVFESRLCSYVAGVQELFPRDSWLSEHDIEGYVGTRLFDAKGRALGLVNVLYRRPIPNVRLAESVLRIFATRASAELEREIAEEELRASEQLSRRIVESMPGGVVRAAPDGSILLANEEAQRFLGVVFDELAERFVERLPDRKMISEDGRPIARAEEPLARCLETGLPQPPRVVGLRGAETVLWGIFTAVPLAGAEGRASEGAVVMFVDITDRKKSEEERRRLEARVQHGQKLESLGVLAGGIAHDFNNLLTGILGNVSLALMKLPPGTELQESLSRAERAAERAAELTNQMLAYAGKGSFVVGLVPLNSVIREIVPLLGSSISKKAGIELLLDEGLPDIEGDRSQIQQVVMNLVTNGSDALQGNEGVIRLRTGVTRDVRGLDLEVEGTDPLAPWVFLEVADDGTGMDERTRARIFEPFFTTKFTGRGLGLAAVQGIVRGHRGAIRVETGPGRGTTFTILLPAVRAGRAEPAPSESSRKLRGSGTVLVIDDEPAVRDVARAALESAGYRVLLAKDGIEGVDMFRASMADIVSIVVDVSMPRMNGEEALQRIRSLEPSVPVLLTSGYTEEDARERFEGIDVSGFIQKPFRASQLIETVGSLARR